MSRSVSSNRRTKAAALGAAALLLGAGISLGTADRAAAATPKPGGTCAKTQLGVRVAYTTTRDLLCSTSGKKYVWVAVPRQVAAPTTTATTAPTTAVRPIYSTDFYKLNEFPTGITANGSASYVDEKYQITATTPVGISAPVPGITAVGNIGMTMKYRVLSGTPSVFLSCYDNGSSWIAAGIREGSTRSYEIIQVGPSGTKSLASGPLPLEYQTANQTAPLTIACQGNPGGPGMVGIGYSGAFTGTAQVPAMPPLGGLTLSVSGPGRVTFDNLLVATLK